MCKRNKMFRNFWLHTFAITLVVNTIHFETDHFKLQLKQVRTTAKLLCNIRKSSTCSIYKSYFGIVRFERICDGREKCKKRNHHQKIKVHTNVYFNSSIYIIYILVCIHCNGEKQKQKKIENNSIIKLFHLPF